MTEFNSSSKIKNSKPKNFIQYTQISLKNATNHYDLNFL
jgi:hypothetical protein